MEWRILRGVPDADVAQVLKLARRRTFRRGEVVFHRHDPGDSLHLIVKGRFAVRVTTPLGDPVTIAVCGPGDSFGEMALVGEEARRSATVEALEDGETFSVFERDFAQLRDEHPEINDLLLQLLVNEMRTMHDRLLEALYVPAERRVLRRLAELSATYGVDGDGNRVIPLTQDEMAGLAGTSRATVNAVLGEAQRRGMVALHRGRISILDGEELARRAQLPS